MKKFSAEQPVIITASITNTLATTFIVSTAAATATKAAIAAIITTNTSYVLNVSTPTHHLKISPLFYI